MDGRSRTSAENGRKGGRPKGFSALAAERMRAKVAEELEVNYDKYFRPQLEKAADGDTFAWKELREFAYGKSQQAVDHTTNGKDMPLPILSQVEKDNG